LDGLVVAFGQLLDVLGLEGFGQIDRPQGGAPLLLGFAQIFRRSAGLFLGRFGTVQRGLAFGVQRRQFFEPLDVLFGCLDAHVQRSAAGRQLLIQLFAFLGQRTQLAFDLVDLSHAAIQIAAQRFLQQQLGHHGQCPAGEAQDRHGPAQLRHPFPQERGQDHGDADHEGHAAPDQRLDGQHLFFEQLAAVLFQFLAMAVQFLDPFFQLDQPPVFRDAVPRFVQGPFQFGLAGFRQFGLQLPADLVGLAPRRVAFRLGLLDALLSLLHGAGRPAKRGQRAVRQIRRDLGHLGGSQSQPFPLGAERLLTSSSTLRAAA
jgi:hypothetical protein